MPPNAKGKLTSQKDGVEIAYTVEENEFRGEKYVELQVGRLSLTASAPLVLPEGVHHVDTAGAPGREIRGHQ